MPAPTAPLRLSELPRQRIAARGSDRLQILDQVPLLFFAEAELEKAVVVVNDILERLESAVVIEPALMDFLCVKQGAQRRGHIAASGAAVGLKVVDPDVLGLVKVIARLGEERRHVTACANRFLVEDALAARHRFGVV